MYIYYGRREYFATCSVTRRLYVASLHTCQITACWKLYVNVGAKYETRRSVCGIYVPVEGLAGITLYKDTNQEKTYMVVRSTTCTIQVPPVSSDDLSSHLPYIYTSMTYEALRYWVPFILDGSPPRPRHNTAE